MNRITRIHQQGTAERNHEAVALLKRAGDCVIVRRGCLRSLVLSCPDGCGTILTVNLDPRSGKAWRLYRSAGTLTLFPSVWRADGCRSHFILWKDRILWCRATWEEASRTDVTLPVSTSLERRISAILPYDKFVSVTVLSEKLEEIPWEVLWACRRLTLAGHVEQRETDEVWMFRKKG